MKEDLHLWFVNHWLPTYSESDYLYWKGAQNQIMWIRDDLCPMFWADVPFRDRRQLVDDHSWTESAFVISTHRSKSVELPVYLIERPDHGLRVALRGNFYNWKLSVESEVPLEGLDLAGLGYTRFPREPSYTGNCLSPVYFEGFPDELIHNYYFESDFRKWSIELYGRNTLYTACYLICRKLDIVKDRRQHTKAEHQAELDAKYGDRKNPGK